MPLLGLGVALAHRRRVQEGKGGAKGGASCSCMALFSRPPLSHVPLPGLCVTRGTKKGVWAPSHSRGVPLLGLHVALALSSAQRGCKGGSVHPLPVLACTLSPVAPLLCTWRMGYVGKLGGGGAHKVGATRQQGRCMRPPPFVPPALHVANEARGKGGAREGTGGGGAPTGGCYGSNRDSYSPVVTMA